MTACKEFVTTEEDGQKWSNAKESRFMKQLAGCFSFVIFYV